MYFLFGAGAGAGVCTFFGRDDVCTLSFFNFLCLRWCVHAGAGVCMLVLVYTLVCTFILVPVLMRAYWC